MESGYSISDRLAIALACIGGVLGLILWLVEKTPLAVALCLCGIFALLIFPILHFARGQMTRLVSFAVTLAALIVLGIGVWPKVDGTPRPAPLPEPPISKNKEPEKPQEPTARQKGSKRPEYIPPPKLSAPFSVEIAGVFYSPDREHAAGFWLSYPGLHSETVSPANAALYLRIVNLQNVPAMIAAYSIESKNANGEWVKLTRIPTVGTVPYAAVNLKDAVQLREDTHFLDRLVREHNLQPREPLEGWVFFEYPKLQSLYRFVPKYRVTITAVTGETYVAEPVAKAYATDDATQPTYFSVKPPKTDLTALHQQYWTDH
jgi:hypothetical protein